MIQSDELIFYRGVGQPPTSICTLDDWIFWPKVKEVKK